eukprot:5647362-Pleurochrysis_carterae.AAC.1
MPAETPVSRNDLSMPSKVILSAQRSAEVPLLGRSNSKRTNFRFHCHSLKLKRKHATSMRIAFRNFNS